MGAVVYLEIRMGRCFSLFGMMVFALGVVALATVGRKPAGLPAPDREPVPVPDRGVPRVTLFPALAFHAPFSLN
jgi:hypothetical protein